MPQNEPTDAGLLTALGERIALARESQSLTQREFARAAGVSRSTIQRLEAGESTQLSNLLPVLRALGAADDLDQLCPAQGAGFSAGGRAPRRGRDAGWRWGGGE